MEERLGQLRSSIEWVDDHIEVIDQTALPARLEVRQLRTVADVVDAIRCLVIRGAPALGVCGAFGMVLGLDERRPETPEAAITTMESLAAQIGASRPTAVNLGYAIERVVRAARDGRDPAEIRRLAFEEARRIMEEDRESCRRIGEFGRQELATVRHVLTHCNTGRLATAGRGTALGIVYAKAQAGEPIEVLASETRPLLQGGRLTAWELSSAGIPVTLVADGAAGAAMASGRVEAVVVGCDRVARNGDTANKIGTYTHAVLARANGIPFYVAGPISSFDPTIASGEEIVIEERPADEVLRFGGVQVAAAVPAWNPAFDVTPGALVTAFITDRGVLRPPYEESIPAALARAEERAGR